MTDDPLTPDERALSETALTAIAAGSPTVELSGRAGRALAKRLRLAENPRPTRTAPYYAKLPTVAPGEPGWAPLHATAERMTLREGDVVAVEMDDGSVRAFVVRHRAWQHGPGCALLIGLEGVVGGYDLDRVRAVKRKEAKA